ncbi:hypothetical protein N9C66_07200 [Akkermansiaceae bacterium]|nr:hypothetical protein [Akkermansiaceae bacterium]
MKLKQLAHPQLLLITAATVLTLTSPGSTKAKPEIKLPTGGFEVTFSNGVFQKCEFFEDATVKVTQDGRTATGTVKVTDGKIIVRYEDNRIEQWSDLDGAYFVNHWHPTSAYPEQASQMGTAEKHLEGKLEVHEWGTFTILQGSDGNPIPWYQAPEKLVDLPPFVHQQAGAFSKSMPFNFANGLDSMRMETPVLYFYPEKAMDVRISASFPKGRITEVFPPVAYQLSILPTTNTLWRGTLLPPNAPEKSRIPEATGQNDRHYAAARAVPDAWLYSQITPRTEAALEAAKKAKAKAKSETPFPLPPVPIDHFIFYRGAGNAGKFPIRAVEQDTPGTYLLHSQYHQTIPKLFALRVVDGKSSWVAIDQLARIDYDKKEKKTLNQKEIIFPEATKSTKEVASELRHAMVAALHSEGLTKDEAKAMVATWDDLWFTDPGTRVLAILPQSYADEMVPLKISPKPTKVERVFVARLELFNKTQEQILSSILDPINAMDDKIASEKLAALNLGRYSAGGMARAKTLIADQIESRFSKLEKLQKKQMDTETASTR